MRIRALLPDSKRVSVERVEIHEAREHVEIEVRSIAPRASCPDCGTDSASIHSWYARKLRDLPWHGFKVTIIWHTRRFVCRVDDCGRKIFTERLPEFAGSGSRRTNRFSLAIRCIAFACGGEPGSRLADRLGIATSPDTLLREIRRTSVVSRPIPRALGVDDWALKRGHRYGTMLCDLESGEPVELLPERNAASLSQWLQDHPGVEVIARDRVDYYIKGATEGAPQATQVADRFHLMQNLREAIVRTIERNQKEIRQAVQEAITKVDDENASDNTKPQVDEDTARRPTQAGLRKQRNRERRKRRYDEVIRLHQQGVSIRGISKQLHLNRKIVRRFLQAGEFPERACVSRRSQLDPYLPYLQQRWDEGCRNAKQLTEEIQQQGYEGSYANVRRRIQKWRRPRPAAKQIGATIVKPVSSANRISWLILKSNDKSEGEDRRITDAILNRCDDVKKAWAVASEFVDMLRNRKGNKLLQWIEQAATKDVPIELRRFAKGLTKDIDAVTAALTLPWNNGSSEGHINRLKLIKRQMYGRANFDLLRQRFLFAT